MNRSIIYLFVCLLTTQCTNSYVTNTSTDTPITIFAAAGCRQACDVVCELFEEENNCAVARNYASSGVLARQVQHGAQCDVFISANKHWIDHLESEGLLLFNSVKELARNRLVVIAPEESNLKSINFKSKDKTHFSNFDKVAIGDPAYVPVGMYTKTLFDTLGWFPFLKNKLVLGKDVTSVLHFVELGEVDWGIVYYTEALKSNKVKILSEIPSDLYKPIVFYICELKQTRHGGEMLFDTFMGKVGQEIIHNYGFVIDNQTIAKMN